jgi:hypothetical protein
MLLPPDECVAQCDFVPRTPPTSVSAVATGGPSTRGGAVSLDQSLWTEGSMGTSMVLTPPPSSQLPFILAAPSPTEDPPHSSRVVSQRIPLTIQVRKARMLLVAIAVVLLLVACIHGLWHGVTIARAQDGVGLTNATARRQREDDLNFYFGTAAALLAKLFDVAAIFMLPIVVLIMLTEHSMLNDSFYWRLGFLLLQGFLISLLTNAFSTTYVSSSEPVVVKRIMTERDLVAPTPPVAATGLDLFRLNATVPRRASTDTMLRTAILPPYATLSRRAKCTEGLTNQSLAARFGFASSDWLHRLAPNGIQLQASLNVSVGDWLGVRPSPSAPAIPTIPHNLTTAGNLVIHTMQFLVDRLRVPLLSASTVDPLQAYARAATLADQRRDPRAFLQSTAEMLNASLVSQHEFGFFFAPSRATLQFSTHSVGSLTFDALTMTLPFRSRLLQRSLVASQFDTLRDDTRFDPTADGDLVDANGDVVYQVFPTDECGTRGCWLPKPINSQEADAVWTIRPEVVAYSRCRATFESIGASELTHTACVDDQIVNNSIVLGAIGSTLLADQFVEFESTGFASTSARVRRANVTNIRRTLSITVAFLSWRVEDLSKVYDVACAGPRRCRGLWYPLNRNSDVLVDADLLIADELTTIAGQLLAGRPLVSVITDLPRGSFLAFSNVQQGIQQLTKDGNLSRIDPTAPTTRWPCSRDVEVVADSIVLNRWFIDHSLQETYTAGLFHLFQFGVPHAVTYAFPESPTKLVDLSGNQVTYEFVAHIPDKGALVSLLSGVLLLVSIFAVVCAGRRRECTIRDLTDVHRVARVHLVDQFFPKVFLKCTVFTTPEGQSLEPFRIVAMRLHRTTPEGDVYVTLPAPAPVIDSAAVSDSTSLSLLPDLQERHARVLTAPSGDRGRR